MLVLMGMNMDVFSQTYNFPDEAEPHEGTWLQWPHQYEYGVAFRNENDATWVAMTDALQANEKVHIIAYNITEKNRIIALLNNAGVPLTNVDFTIHQTNDVWVRDNGPIYVRDSNGDLVIEDWGFNGWGGDYNFAKCNPVPTDISTATGMTVINLNSIMVNEGGAIEMDGNGALLATKSSILSQSNPTSQIKSIRNLGMTQAQAEAIFSQYYGATKFIWLDGWFSTDDITDAHIDGFAKFAPGNKLVTMTNADLLYWGVPQSDINILFAATNANNIAYTKVFIPLTQNDVLKLDGTPLGYKGSYANYYVANNRVLVPNYNDPNDAIANNIIAGLYPDRTVVGIDVRNLYGNGGMIHCVTQQQPAASLPTGSIPSTPNTINGNTTVCSGSSNTYSVTAVTGATSYNWTLPNGWTGTSTTNSITTNTSTTSGNITVSASNSYGTSSVTTLSIVVNTTPTMQGSINGNTSICSGSSNTYSVTAVAGATSYNWTFPSGWTGTSSTNSISTTANATSGNISVSASNNCGSSGFVSKTITVNSPSSSLINQTACGSFTLNSQTYTTSGIYTQQFTNIAGCDSVLTLNLTVLNPINFSQTVSLCSGESLTVGSNTYNTSGVYTDTFTATNGCDSIVSTNLTVIGQIDISTNVNGSTITVNMSNVSYQWLNCDNGNIPIVGANAQSYSATSDGNYAVVVTNGSCSDTSSCINITTTGIDEMAENSLINIFPNPSNGLFLIGLNLDAQIVITDAIGREVWNKQEQAGKFIINLQNESNGLYFVKVKTLNGQIIKQIVVNK